MASCALPLETRSSRKKVFWIVIVTGGCCGAYCLYYSKFAAEQRQRIFKFYESLTSVADLVSSSSNVLKIAANDLEAFISSDSELVPQSIRQLLKISQCVEFQSAVSTVSRSIFDGVSRSNPSLPENVSCGNRASSVSTLDVVMNKLFSSEGRGFASAIVGKAVRNMVYAFFEQQKRKQALDSRKSGQSNEGKKLMDHILDVSTTAKGKELISLVVSTFTVCAVNTFLEKTEDVNVCEDMVSTITKEEHRKPVTELLRSVCGEAVESLVRTSHDVLTSERKRRLETVVVPVPTSSSIQPKALVGETTDGNGLSEIHEEINFISASRTPEQQALKSWPASTWQTEIGKLLAVPEARQTLVDVTGTMTVQGMRTIISVCLEMIAGGSAKDEGSSDTALAVKMGSLGYMRRLAGSALTASSVCLALVLHVLTGS